MPKIITEKPIPGFTSPAVEESKKEIERLRKTHWLYDIYKPRWLFYLSAYEGGEQFTCVDNLFKHQREHQEDFKDRAKRIHNLNYCEPLVDFFTNFIFSETIERNGGKQDQDYQDFIADVSRKGEPVDAFMRQVCDDMQIYGMAYILVDSPRIDIEITKYEQQIRKIKPYWVLVSPTEILDWVVDKLDNYQYVKRVEYVTELRGGRRVDIERYYEFYNDQYIITELDVTDRDKPLVLSKEVIVNPIGAVPIVVARYKRSKKDKDIGLSFLRDFAYNQREIMNLTSLLQEFLYRQAFNILAIETDSALPAAEQQEGVVGTANSIQVPKGASMPQYISPPAEPAAFIQEERTRIKSEMVARASQEAVNELFNGEKSSGFSQAQSFSKTVPFIASRADILEHTEHKLMMLTMKLFNKEWDGKIKYKDDYSITNLTDGLTQFMILVKDLQLGSETFIKEELKRMVQEFDGKLSEEVLNKVFKEIDEINIDTWKKTQKDALVGKSGTSAGEQQKKKESGTMVEAAAEAKAVNTGSTKKLKE